MSKKLLERIPPQMIQPWTETLMGLARRDWDLVTAIGRAPMEEAERRTWAAKAAKKLFREVGHTEFDHERNLVAIQEIIDHCRQASASAAPVTAARVEDEGYLIATAWLNGVRPIMLSRQLPSDNIVVVGPNEMLERLTG